MKTFKTFLMEKEELPNKNQSDKQDDKSDEKALTQLMGLNAGYSWIQRPEDNAIARGDLSMAIAKSMTPPSMAAHKAWNTDVGMAFDLSPDGELVGNPEGFKAVHQRTKEGKNVKFKEFDYDKYRQGLLHKLSFGLIGKPEEG